MKNTQESMEEFIFINGMPSIGKESTFNCCSQLQNQIDLLISLPPKLYFSWKIGLLNRTFGLLTPRPRRGNGLARRAPQTEIFSRRALGLSRRALCTFHLFLLPLILQALYLPHVLLKFLFSSKPATITPTSDSICFTHELNLFSSILNKNLWICHISHWFREEITSINT